MSNLLPQEVQREVWSGFRARFMLAAALLFIAVALLSAAALLPSYLALFIGAPQIASQKKIAEATASDKSDVARAQALAQVLGPVASATTSSSLIRDALSKLPNNIRVIHITGSTGHPGTIILSGIAANAEAINQYQGALRADPNFISVSVPVSDLVGAGNGEFTMTLLSNF